MNIGLRCEAATDPREAGEDDSKSMRETADPIMRKLLQELMAARNATKNMMIRRRKITVGKYLHPNIKSLSTVSWAPLNSTTKRARKLSPPFKNASFATCVCPLNPLTTLMLILLASCLVGAS